jgi:hypothetical protein
MSDGILRNLLPICKVTPSLLARFLSSDWIFRHLFPILLWSPAAVVLETEARVPRASPLTAPEDANPLANPRLSDLIGISQNSVFLPCDESADCIEVFHERVTLGQLLKRLTAGTAGSRKTAVAASNFPLDLDVLITGLGPPPFGDTGGD